MSPAQITRIKEIIKKYTEVLTYITTGEGDVSSNFLKKLKIPKDTPDLVSIAYYSGKLKVLKGVDLDSLTAQELENLISKLSLTPTQKRALEFSRINTGTKISGLSNSMTTGVVGAVVSSNLSQLQGIQQIVTEGLATTQTRAEVAIKLREFSQDWSRDWNRVAHTEMWNARLNGESMALINNESPLSNDGENTLVFKRPAPNACNHCKKHYLENDGVTPKIFRLKDLIANGTNYGKKTADWLPVLGVMHPNCMCTLSVLPKGYEFDSNGQLTLV